MLVYNLYYCKYSSYGIPQYYGEHIVIKETNDDTRFCSHKHSIMFIFNRWVTENIKILKMLNRKRITCKLMKNIISCKETDFQYINDIIIKRDKSIEDFKGTYNEYIDKENAEFGFCDIDNNISKWYCLAKVKLNWPTRGKNIPLECSIKVNCESDLLLVDYNENDSNVVEKTANKFGEEFINKCFWTGLDKVCKLWNRVTDTATTYNKNGSDCGWRDEYSID